MLGWDPRISKYLGYFRPGHPIAREIDGIGKHRHIRTIGYSTSEDFIRWTPTEIMLAPDEGDRVDSQYMQFTAAWYEGFYVGLLMIHQTHEQTWDTYLLSSRDGFHWNWIDRPRRSSDAAPPGATTPATRRLRDRSSTTARSTFTMALSAARTASSGIARQHG